MAAIISVALATAKTGGTTCLDTNRAGSINRTETAGINVHIKATVPGHAGYQEYYIQQENHAISFSSLAQKKLH